MNGETVLFDFDNTLTKTDTTKFLLLSLLIYKPLRIFDILRLTNHPEKMSMDFQLKKIDAIGKLIEGYDQKVLNKRLWLFSFLVKKNYNENLIKELQRFIGCSFKVIIASASPVFALKKIFVNTNLVIIGTEYSLQNGKFTAHPTSIPCYGENKAIMVSNYLKENGITNVKYAYSDHLSDIPFLSLACESFIVGKDGSLSKMVNC